LYIFGFALRFISVKGAKTSPITRKEKAQSREDLRWTINNSLINFASISYFTLICGLSKYKKRFLSSLKSIQSHKQKVILVNLNQYRLYVIQRKSQKLRHASYSNLRIFAKKLAALRNMPKLNFMTYSVTDFAVEKNVKLQFSIKSML